MSRIAVAGAAHPHVEYALDEVARSERLELVAVADPDRGVAERCAGRFGAAVFTDHRQMLAEAAADVVVVAGVYGERGGVVVDALAAGCDVLADKPLCTSLDELDRIEAAARASGRRVTLLLEKRYYPETLAALELVRSGELGHVVGIASSGPHKLGRGARPPWFFEPRRYGGILNDLAVHDIDAALLFTGAQRGTVSGAVTAALPDAPGFATYGVASVATPDALITAEVSWLTPAASALHGDYRMRITGTEGSAELYWARHRLEVTTATAPTRDVALPGGFRPAELPLLALSRGEEPDVSTREGILATRLALLAQHSAESSSEPVAWAAAPSPAEQLDH
jgi:predicted dehydrogenase